MSISKTGRSTKWELKKSSNWAEIELQKLKKTEKKEDQTKIFYGCKNLKCGQQKPHEYKL